MDERPLSSERRAAHDERETGRGAAVLDSLLTRDSTRMLATRRLARSIDRLLYSQLIRLVIHREFLVNFGEDLVFPPNFVLIPRSVLRRSGILPVFSTTCDGATELVSVPSE